MHILMYMFPRQFGLHNVFASSVDRQQTIQKFQDYTLREEEIAKKFPAPAEGKKPANHVPKRLRGKAMHLVRRLQVLHKRCSYAEMLHHYCPVSNFRGLKHTSLMCVQALGQDSRQRKTQASPIKPLPPSSRPSAKSRKAGKKSRLPAAPVPDLQYTSITELATPVSSVSAFCQAVLAKVIPDEFWGEGSTREHNKRCFMKQIHHFINLRRFESMCLHEVMQGMKVGTTISVPSGSHRR